MSPMAPHAVLTSHTSEFLTLCGRQAVAAASITSARASQRRTAVSVKIQIAADLGDRLVAGAHQLNGLGLELRCK
jgi:hypothetical protein